MARIIEKKAFNILADYFQIYVYDQNTELSNLELKDWWTKKDHEILLSQKLGNKFIVIGTYRDFSVPISIDYYSEHPPLADFENWDLINEVSMYVPSKKIVFSNIHDVSLSNYLNVSSTFLRLRIYYTGKNTISEDGTEGDDSYYIQCWGQLAIYPLEVLKK